MHRRVLPQRANIVSPTLIRSHSACREEDRRADDIKPASPCARSTLAASQPEARQSPESEMLVSTRVAPRARGLSATPVAAHVRHDHGAARTKFLHVVCVANAHRVRPRIVAGIDVIGLRIREDSNSCSGTSLRRQIRRSQGGERRRGRRPARRRFRLRRRRQQQCAAQADQKCRCHPDHGAHPKAFYDPTVTVFASRVNSTQAAIISHRRRAGTRARLDPCGRA